MSAKQDSLLAACIMRAGAALVREDIAGGRDPNVAATRRETMRAIWSSTISASKVASLIVLWATAQLELEREDLGVEEFALWAAESRATVYRRLQEFRRVWPEYDTPNEVAALVGAEVKRRGGSPSLNVQIPVSA